MRIVVLPGDGIGPAITAVTVAALEAASKKFDLGITLDHDVTGLEGFKRHGKTVTPELVKKVEAADGLLLGPTDTYVYKGEGQINPSMFFRKHLDLFANIRPARTYPGVPTRVNPFDLVVVRENTEGFYADRNMAQGGSEMLVTPDVVVSLRRITRQCCERIARAGFELAMRRRKKVTLVHKANVLKLGDGMFLDVAREVGKAYPDVAIDEVIVDAMMAHVVRAPEKYDVIVTTNMFGDILSDLTAELSGSLGLGGSINAGDQHAMAQAAHGSAPDIAGKDIANPFSLILSTALLLDWHGRRKNLPAFNQAARAMEEATVDAVAAHEATTDVGGKLGTRETGVAFVKRILAS